MRKLRKHLKGWNLNQESWYKKEKRDIIAQMDVIDKTTEQYGLDAETREKRRQLEC